MIDLKTGRLATCAALLGGLWLGGCATTQYVDKHVAVVQSDVNGVKTDVAGLHSDLKGVHGQIKDQDAKLAGLDQSTRDALARADAAGKLAEGKFVYSLVLTDEAANFKSGGAKLSADAQSRLNDFVGKLKSDNKNVYVEIQGYTDSRGSEAANYRLGQDRAETVRRYLSKQGVALNRMSTISYGADDPVASNRTAKGRSKNRRVVVIVLQ
jgi:peptidoglycan-associated lipoprotein